MQNFRQKLQELYITDQIHLWIHSKFATAAQGKTWTDTYIHKFHLYISFICRCMIVIFGCNGMKYSTVVTSIQWSHPKSEAQCLRVSPDHRAHNKISDEYIRWRPSISNSILIPATLYRNSVIPDTYITVLNHPILALICLYHPKKKGCTLNILGGDLVSQG